MGLIKSGISKNKLRTILVASILPKNVREACEFFNFEIKNIYKEKTRNIREGRYHRLGIPSREELVKFIKNRTFVNFSDIARFYSLNNATVSDLVDDLVGMKLVKIKKIGANKIVMVKKEGKNA